MIEVKKKEQVPKKPHYAVLVYKTSSVYHEGDERSRTNPGHGYPAYTEQINNFEHYVSEDKNEWENFVKALHMTGEKNFVFFRVAEVGSLEVNVVIK